MAGLAGKKFRLKVGTTSGGSFTIVAGLKSVSVELGNTLADDSEFGVDFEQKLAGLNSWKMSGSGHYRPADTDGQVAVLSSWLNGTDLFAEALPDNGTTSDIGFKGQVIVTKFGLDPAVDGEQAVSIELQGTGVLSLI